MNKAELISSVAKSANVTKVKAKMVLNNVLKNMVNTMKDGEKVSLFGFGTFSVVERVEKKGRNPNTGQDVIIPAHNSVKFKSGKALYGRVQ